MEEKKRREKHTRDKYDKYWRVYHTILSKVKVFRIHLFIPKYFSIHSVLPPLFFAIVYSLCLSLPIPLMPQLVEYIQRLLHLVCDDDNNNV